MVLLHLAASTLDHQTLHVLHINHHLQLAADEWSLFCQQQADRLSIPFTKIDVYPKDGSEAAARESRYRAFEAFLQPGDLLLQGHHGDDQAETMLFRLVRGTGPRGLAGIPQYRVLGKAALLRPLLEVPKSVIKQWAVEHALAWVEDPSNHKSDYDRNFLRLHVLPLLSKRWPSVTSTLIANQRLIKSEQALLDELLDEQLESMLSGNSLNIGRLADHNSFRRQALLRRWIFRKTQQLLGSSQLAQIERDFFQSSEDRLPQLLIGTFILRRYRGSLYLNVSTHPEDSCETLLLGLGQHLWREGQLTVKCSESGGLKTLEGISCVSRREGMSCRPVGRQHKSLKKLFQESGVPPWMREQWPILVHENEVVAIPGICVCEGWQSQAQDKPSFTVIWEPF